jgi:phosphatidylserine decarboxylase
VAPEGVPIIAAFFVISTALSASTFIWFGPWGWLTTSVGFVLTLWCIWFFRDPDRSSSADQRAVISPADGVVCFVGEGSPPADLGLEAPEGGWLKISVFMNVFNVHVNRAPVAGTISKIAYHAGQFLNASFDKASELNERIAMAISTADGRSVVAVQIAGLVARRIVSRVKEGLTLARGERYGLIRFGSRVDVYLPASGAAARVKLKDKTIAGETVLADLAPVQGMVEPRPQTGAAATAHAVA